MCTLNTRSPAFLRLLLSLSENATKAVTAADRPSHGFGPSPCFRCDYRDGSHATMRIGWQVLGELRGLGVDVSSIPSGFGEVAYKSWCKEHQHDDCLTALVLPEVLTLSLSQHFQEKT